MLVDSHCHLDYEPLANDLDGILARAKQSEISTLLTISTQLSKFSNVLTIAEKYPHIFCTVGVHPHEAKSEENLTSTEKLIEYTKHPKVVALGETGLDYYYNHSEKKDQWKNFEKHIEAAQETELPLIIHTRDADNDTVNILTQAYQQKAITGVIHCFSASRELAEKMIEIGFYISLSGILTFKSAQDIQNTVKGLPMDRLLVETDSPYLAPVPHRGKSNEPAFVRHVAEKLADLKEVPLHQVMEQTTDNFFRLFTKCKFGIDT